MKTPYTKDDLERPASEGRSLHDHSSLFYKEIMGLSTPLVKVPTSKEIQSAINSSLKHDTNPILVQMIKNLRVTPLTSLWPEYSDNPPPTKEGALWHAANSVDDKNNTTKIWWA